jgi:hypothetical protein
VDTRLSRIYVQRKNRKQKTLGVVGKRRAWKRSADAVRQTESSQQSVGFQATDVFVFFLNSVERFIPTFSE